MERYAEMRKENRGVMATGRASAARIIAKRDASCCVALRPDTPLLCHYIRNGRMTFAAKSTDIVDLRLERQGCPSLFGATSGSRRTCQMQKPLISQGFYVELMTRIELVTSSLPRMCSTC